jgi:annexin A13
MQAGEETYDPQFHTADKAIEDAEAIYAKGQGKFFGTDEKSIFKVLCAAPPEHVENINRVYADKYGYTLLKAMEKELGGNVRDGTLHMLGMKLKPYETAAQLIKAACAGIGTDEMLLTCSIIRYQNVMKDVMGAHIELYGKSVHDRVRSECKGAYKDVLLAALNAVWPEAG